MRRCVWEVARRVPQPSGTPSWDWLDGRGVSCVVAIIAELYLMAWEPPLRDWQRAPSHGDAALPGVGHNDAIPCDACDLLREPLPEGVYINKGRCRLALALALVPSRLPLILSSHQPFTDIPYISSSNGVCLSLPLLCSFHRL